MIIPFFIPHSGCPHQCVFCNQKNITGRDRPVDVSTISQKITAYLAMKHNKGPVQAAFYGGSFTALPLKTQRSYLEPVRPFISAGLIQSIRLSTRPDYVSREILSFLKDHYVSTVELGVQSLDDTVLLLSGRGHTAAHTATAVKLLKEQGFCIGLQLMPGLPGDSAETFMNTVNRVAMLKPDFVRIYPLLVIKGTPLEELFKTGRYAPLSLDDAVSQCRGAMALLAEHGIDVVRVGLQPTEEMAKPGTILAGPYHPAFRQLVESSILLDAMRECLSGRPGNSGAVVFFVNPKDVSAAAGHKRSNLGILKKEFGLEHIGIRPDGNAARRTARAGNDFTGAGNAARRRTIP